MFQNKNTDVSAKINFEEDIQFGPAELIEYYKQQNQAKYELKYEKKLMRLNINCKIKYLDFEGMSDIESMKKIISKLRPEKLVIFISNLFLSKFFFAKFLTMISIKQKV